MAREILLSNKVFAMDPTPGSPKDVFQLDPRVQNLFMLCVAYLKGRLGAHKIITVTSCWRADGIHATGRALDFDIDGLEADPATRQALAELAGLVNSAFPYGPGADKSWHFAFVWETDDKHRNHVHLQVKP